MTVANPVGIEELRQLAAGRFGDMVKGVIDLERAVLLLDADLHADQEAVLNRSRGVDEPSTRQAITALVEQLVRR